MGGGGARREGMWGERALKDTDNKEKWKINN